jgi:hypothetical protein
VPEKFTLPFGVAGQVLDKPSIADWPASCRDRIHAHAKVSISKLKTLDLSHLRTLEQALADLIAKRDMCADPSNERAQLDRMIRDLEAEIAVRKG